MNYGLVLAGGIGSRMGSGVPKQFLKVHGHTILSYTVKVFLANSNLNTVIVLVPEEWEEETKKILSGDLGETPRLVITAGGKSRNETIMKGIAYIRAADEDCENAVLVTHDAARPFVTGAIIDANIRALEQYSACATAVPATDTILESLDGRTIHAIPDRAVLYSAQTPQSFRLGEFEALYQDLTEEEKKTLTDAAKVFVLKGKEVALVSGIHENIKITYPGDIALAEGLLIAADSSRP